MTYPCAQCNKVLATPVPCKDHKWSHGANKFFCGWCNKGFLSMSQLNLHQHIHRRQCRYSCFAKSCKHCYKWLQDLLRHIKVHFTGIYKCPECTYSNKEKCLLKQHMNIHTDELPFKCRTCNAEVSS